MSSDRSEPLSDVWSEWLLHHRHADDPTYDRIFRGAIGRYVDRVLDGARLEAGMTLVDVGAGDGIVAFRAIERIGPSLRVILTDISAPMLQHAERLSIQRGVRDRCTFLQCSAEHLGDIGDASVDAVTTRAALAYVADKSAALREFRRVLRPGGRLSIAEPVFQDDAFAARALRMLLDTRPPDSPDRFMPLLHRWKSAQYPDTEEKIRHTPFANYSERDLIRFVQETGFAEIHLELHIDVAPNLVPSWDVFLRTTPHPLAPSLSVILAEQFSAEERQLFEQVLRPQVEDPKSV
jgi:ubiquinone/menaquinone biosynthesis C-methylase UbiE